MNKTFRLIGTALIAIMISMNFAACSSEDDNMEEPIIPSQPSIEDFNQTDMNFTEKADQQTFSFIVNDAWTVSIASTSGENTWCTASPTSGESGRQYVQITTTENDTYDDRSVTVTLKAGNESKSFVVTQKQKNAILLTSNKFEIEQKGGTFTVEVKANVNYTATIGETCKGWITERSNTRALSTTTKTYSVAANEDSEKREGTITFTDKDSGLKEVLTVTQEENRKIVTIDVPVAGELSNITERTDFKALKLTGRLNGEDVRTIRRMKHLEYLDISEVDIIGGEYYYVESKFSGGHILLEDNTIGELMFNNDATASLSPFENLKEVLLPNSVTRIDNHAFDRVYSLCKVSLPDKLETIGNSAFRECSSITNITIPNGVTTIESHAFYDCKGLYSITISNSVTTIGDAAFYSCEKLIDISLPSNLTKIERNTFSGCYSLRNIKIPEGVTIVDSYAFERCQNLENVSMPTSVIEIESHAFYACKSLTGITIPNGVKTIGESAFSFCPISNVTIPQSVTVIGSRAFEKLNEVRIFCTTPPSGYIECDKLYIPKGTYQKYFLTNWGAYATNIIEMEE